MSSSEDDIPLVGGGKLNGNNRAHSPKSKETISADVDREMNKENPPHGRGIQPGITLRHGPVEEMDVDEPATNGVTTNGDMQGKRKSRASVNGTKSYKEQSSDEDEEPLSKRRRTSAANRKAESESDDEPIIAKKKSGAGLPKKPHKVTKEDLGLSDDSDAPISAKLTKTKASIEKQAEKEAKNLRKEEKKPAASKRAAKKEESDDEPIQKKRRGTATKKTPVKKEESDDDVPLARKAPAKKATGKGKTEAPAPAKRQPKSDAKSKTPKREQTEEAGEDDEEEFRWWENPMKGDGTKKWTSLEHNGVIFPPPYEPLPANVKLLYDGTPVKLHPEAEEVAGFFGIMLNSTHNVENPTFQKNFFDDFQKVLKKTGGATDKDGKKVNIKEFSKLDFRQIFEYYESKKIARNSRAPAEKKAEKAEKEKDEAPYMFCLWDGRKQKVGNFRVEPPGLFRGRGEHPKTGRVKQRVLPEQITLNIGKDAQVPAPPEGHRWKEVKHDQEGTWLAMWTENINGAYKYVMLAANSDIKGQSDFKKFEKARELKKHIDHIRKDYRKNLTAKLMADRQLATAVYLIDQFALRAGNEKGEDEADTVGCCSLKYEHVTLKPPNKVVFDFLGKDSIRFYEEFDVDPLVFTNLKIFKKPPKEEGDEIFDRLNTSTLNKHLSGYMQGLTAKVFRTYNASFTMSQLLQKMKSEGSVAEKVKDYNEANREVAVLCNHKRTVAAGHAGQMEKMGDRIKGLQYQRWRVKQMMIDLEGAKIKKKKGAQYFELDEDLDEEWIKEHQAFLVQEQRQKIEKKFQKDNEKLVAEGEKEMKTKELQERLKAADELADKFKKENKTKKVVAEGKGVTLEKLEANVEKLDQRITTMQVQALDKDNNKEVSLGTSKINYIDPRLTVVFSKKFNVPIEKFFSKTLREKFDWAIKSADENWEF
ncbi:topoisomerase I [Xylona heveae TC161]|uniref:DNA topoisomerase I n=1 Tax=Xylona heveae (strain CBS 132557 / TC161) TaxID=1328760 RepID=A0A165JAB5_XYLHT|nr:topoisomerase I [Xylona heveae TC161]KZF25965.1 topoisomerase I [Xylona heveae TC161]